MKVNFWVADTCLPGYWQGSDLPYVQVAVRHDTTVSGVYDDLADELRFHYMQGHDCPGRFVDACLEAVVARKAALLDKGFDLSAPYDSSLEPVPEGYDGEECYAYVVFEVESYTREDVLGILWERVRDAVSSVWVDDFNHVTLKHGRRLHAWSEDEEAMKDAPGDDLCAWMDDVEARLGGDVANARAAMNDYCCFRDGEDGGFEAHEVEFVETSVMAPLGVQL